MAAACTVYIIGWFINIMDVDAGQYASMTREMLERGEYLRFTDRGNDYLDKPPLLFWVSGLSMSLFGINNIAYRIPSFLATLLALYATYRLATLYYSRKTGYLAVIILATTQAVFLINHDVRTDTNLMCWFIFSMWQLAAFLEKRKAIHFILAFAGIGLAMLAKGPIGLIAPAMGIFVHLVLKKDWKTLFYPPWFLGLIVIAVILLPMSYGLYTQFDLHPEKIVNGQTGVSGLRFYYWTQSFGRITGESIWENDSGPFFLSHSTLWAFAPWSIFLVMGLWREIKLVYRHVARNKVKKEFLILFGFLLPFMALSSSRYQLPHYAFIVYPLGAIIAARYILGTFYPPHIPGAKAVYRFHLTILVILLIFVFFTVGYSFPSKLATVLFLFTTAIFFVGFIVFQKSNRHKLVLLSLGTAVFINLVLNIVFYPELLRYQAGSVLAQKAVASGLTKNALYTYQAETPYSMDFYSKDFMQYEDDIEKLVNRRNIWVYIKESDLEIFMKRRPDLVVIGSMGDYPVTQLSLEFLNPATREKTLARRCLIKL